jgi:hypothetical protein
MPDFADVPAQELFHQWLRELTVLTEPGDRPLPERITLIAEVNDIHPRNVKVPYPPSREDLQRVAEVIASLNRLRSREHGIHGLVTSVLLGWLSEATGQSRSDIIARLTLTIDGLLTARDADDTDR